ncbi:hypothetical protein NH340_JMT00451 [Sarcoptes scabiei]|nr:hypothetical protein NH340_JMT00451 [Sarcoptes scabiei]
MYQNGMEKAIRFDRFRLPNGAEQLDYQIAGHRFDPQRKKLGLLKHCDSGDILKPIFDQRCEREKLFYEDVFDCKNDSDLCYQRLRSMMPSYNGLFCDTEMNLDYIRLEDVTKNFLNASILDIKIGPITYDPMASEEKRKLQIEKYKHQTDLGFRILGMKIYDPERKTYDYKDKEFGLQINPGNVTKAFAIFTRNNRAVLEQFLNELNPIEEWFEKYNRNRWKFYSSSLLLAYGQLKPNRFNDISVDPQLTPKSSTKVLIRLIDFAHVFPNDGDRDENYLFGISKLKNHLRKTLKEFNIIEDN